jgi:hypothetical protein
MADLEMDDLPALRLRWMVEAAREYGRYPLE